MVFMTVVKAAIYGLEKVVQDIRAGNVCLFIGFDQTDQTESQVNWRKSPDLTVRWFALEQLFANCYTGQRQGKSGEYCQEVDREKAQIGSFLC